MTINERPKSSVEIRSFEGINTHADRHDLKPGEAQVQTNVTVQKSNQLQVRSGYRVVRFEE